MAADTSTITPKTSAMYEAICKGIGDILAEAVLAVYEKKKLHEMLLARAVFNKTGWRDAVAVFCFVGAKQGIANEDGFLPGLPEDFARAAYERATNTLSTAITANEKKKLSLRILKLFSPFLKNHPMLNVEKPFLISDERQLIRFVVFTSAPGKAVDQYLYAKSDEVEAKLKAKLGPYSKGPITSARFGATVAGVQAEGDHQWLVKLMSRGYFAKIEKALDIKLGRMYGCGAYGCTFDTTRHNLGITGSVTTKITSDPDEGPVMRYVQEMQEKGDKAFLEGFVNVFQVARLKELFELPYHAILHGDPTVKHRIYVIVREDVQPLESLRRDLTDAGLNPGITFDDVAVRMGNYKSAAKDYNRAEANFADGGGSIAHSRIARSMLESAIRDITYYAPRVANALLAFWAKAGVAIEDVHVGNIGFAHQRTPGNIVIFDPGQTSADVTKPMIRKTTLIKNNPFTNSGIEEI